MSEIDQAVNLAIRVLDKSFIDPDGNISLLARHLLRQIERAERAESILTRSIKLDGHYVMLMGCYNKGESLLSPSEKAFITRLNKVG
jgi:hypothetical protein